jgi:hypothetical protein
MSNEFSQVRYRLDRFQPDIKHRVLKRIKVGTWFFGLLNVYHYYWEWTE